MELYGPTWSLEGPSLTNPDNLRRVEEALREGWVCGIHLLYGAGASGHPIAFATFEKYLAYVDQARPGDLFTLWSVAELRKRSRLLVDAHYETAEEGVSSLLSTTDLDRVQAYLSIGVSYEILAVASLRATSLHAVWTDLGGSEWENFLNLARQAYDARGALCVLPLTTIDQPEMYLLKGKRPNEKGEVPLGGAY
jgi:hypothetical protein